MLTGAEVAAAIASIKNLRDLVTAMKDSADKRKLSAAVEDVQAKTINLQATLIEALQSLSSANERAHTAEQKYMDLENFARESERYTLREITAGSFAYALRPGMENGEPSHSLCANCFGRHEKSILQSQGDDMAASFARRMICPKCKTRILAP